MTVVRTRVGDVLQLDRDEVTPEPGSEYTTIGVRSFGKGIFHYEPKAGDELGSLRFFSIKPNRLIVSNIKGWEGAIAVSDDADSTCFASNRFLQYQSIGDRIDVGWARWFFLSEPGLELIQRASPGSADRNRTLAIERFENLEIALPPIDVQRATAAELSRVQRRISRLDALDLARSDIVSFLPLSVHHHLLRECRLTETPLGEMLEQVREPIEIDPVEPYTTIGIRSFGKGIFHYPSRPGSEIGKLRFFAVAPGLLAVSNIKAWEGAIATTSAADIGAVASNRFLFFRPRAGEDATDYFWSVLLNQEGLESLGHASPGSADRNRTLAVDRFLRITLPIAEPDEQRLLGRRIRHARRVAGLHQAKAKEMRYRIDAILPAAMNQAFTAVS